MCVHVLICMLGHVYTCSHMHACACVTTGSQRSVSGVFIYCSLSYFLRLGLSGAR